MKGKEQHAKKKKKKNLEKEWKKNYDFEEETFRTISMKSVESSFRNKHQEH